MQGVSTPERACPRTAGGLQTGLASGTAGMRVQRSAEISVESVSPRLRECVYAREAHQPDSDYREEHGGDRTFESHLRVRVVAPVYRHFMYGKPPAIEVEE
jgi:hypothetical protein